MKCRLCGIANDFGFREERSICQFNNSELVRYSCPHCGVIFGPISMIEMPIDVLKKEYEELYKGYSECDSTDLELRIFQHLRPHERGKYLNYGSGKNRTTEVLRSRGYTVYDCDFTTQSAWAMSEEEIAVTLFDGIFSNNVIEHFQDPVGALKQLASRLGPRSLMAHGSTEYGYNTPNTRFHLFFFCGQSVNVLCEKAGIRVVHDENQLRVFERITV